MINDPFTQIATPEALSNWLTLQQLGELSELLIARDWLGNTLLTLDFEQLDEALGEEAAFQLFVALKPLKAFRKSPCQLAETRAEIDQAAEYCRALGRDWQQQAFLADVLAQWPSPIAHEIYMLGKLLLEGKTIGALMQLRDCAEILIKMPAIILAKDILDNSNNGFCRKV